MNQALQVQPDNEVINWLLEAENPGVRTRTLTELCGYSANSDIVQESRMEVAKSLDAVRNPSWMAMKGQILVYNLSALAEAGLSRRDVDVEAVVNKLLSQPFDNGCGEVMAFRAMVMLGYGQDGRVIDRLSQMKDNQLPDGGWLCLHRLKKMDRTPRSCIKVAMHGLLLASELKKRGMEINWAEGLIQYFLKRRLYYRTDHPSQLVLNLAGRRMTDVFFPSEFFHVGLPLLLEALAVLGVGNAPELEEAWVLLDKKKDAQGRIVLEGTLPTNKSYLPRERVGKPTKWGTLYAYLASKHL